MGSKIPIHNFIYLGWRFWLDRDDILWFLSAAKEGIFAHFARLLASLCDEGAGGGYINSRPGDITLVRVYFRYWYIRWGYSGILLVLMYTVQRYVLHWWPLFTRSATLDTLLQIIPPPTVIVIIVITVMIIIIIIITTTFMSGRFGKVYG